MRKRTTTRWYIGAWVIWISALLAPLAIGRAATAANVVLTVAALVGFVMWIGALGKLAQQREWGWCAFVLALQLIFLGIIGMVGYAVAGPDDTEDVVIRPSTT